MEEKKKTRIAVLQYKKCQPHLCNYACIRACPGVRMGQETIVKNEETKKPVISEELCTGCGICIHKCPFGAISIVNLSASLSTPLHQYGKNAFRLYNSPTPRKNAVVGLIGKNGLGKTTVLKILSKEIIPNLGELKEEASLEKVINYFKGKEVQAFFEKLKNEQVRVSLKPQNIEVLLEEEKGKVGEALKKAGKEKQTKELNEIIKSLELEEILEREISKLSGGELQRLAIALASIKEADYYFFDEPSSFLDVKHRLNAAKFISALSEKEKSILLVEHDLAVLDILSDYTHVFFGQQHVFGAVSSIKSSRNGINEFLEGYLREENIRFRDTELRFIVRPPSQSRKKRLLLEYPFLQKKLGSFSLETEKGQIMQGETIGILGPNAIGKTTFVKMLASVISPDNTKLSLNLKISYKPQTLSVEKGEKVSDLFRQKGIDSELFKTQIKKKLGLSELMELECSSLSGGELQKVAIALCLCREADLYLLDEPSAFIDAEDRINTADAIKEVIEKKQKAAFVVDHDILFIDCVSDRLIVFEGTPAQKGKALEPKEMHEGMNLFLKNMNITFRRDPTTGRPRANKLNSAKDKEQKQKGEYYYSLS